MEYLIAFGIWFVLGGIVSFALNAIGVSITRNKETPGFNGLSPLFIAFSFFRLYLILILISYATEWRFPGISYTIIIIADIAFSLLVMFSCSSRYGNGHPISYMKTGQSVGSIIFLIYYGIRFYLL